MDDATQRFSNRVANYVRARPSYPAEALELLTANCGLGPGATVADIGSGTGILTRLLLERDATVFAVEPNAAMREAAEQALGAEAGFRSVAATAEATTLPDAAIDLVTAAQAFHWFDRVAARREFVRILRPGGWAAIIWNDRRLTGTPFLEAYERLLHTYGTDYATVNHQNITPADMAAFFGGAHVARATFPYTQIFDLAGLEARLFSSSYTPAPGHPGYAEMHAALAAIFAAYQQDGAVAMVYDTTVYYGRLP